MVSTFLEHFESPTPTIFPEGTESKYSNSHSSIQSRQTLGSRELLPRQAATAGFAADVHWVGLNDTCN